MILKTKTPPSMGTRFGELGFGGGGVPSLAKPTKINNEHAKNSKIYFFLRKVFILIILFKR